MTTCFAQFLITLGSGDGGNWNLADHDILFVVRLIIYLNMLVKLYDGMLFTSSLRNIVTLNSGFYQEQMIPVLIKDFQQRDQVGRLMFSVPGIER